MGANIPLVFQFETINARDAQRALELRGLYSDDIKQRYAGTFTPLDVPFSQECPCCNKVMSNDIKPVVSVNNGNLPKEFDDFDECDCVSIYRCTSCNHLYAVWSYHRKLSGNDDDELEYSCSVTNIFPFNRSTKNFEKEILELSPDFVKIYKQAELAENQGLLEICGMGYRKALEFLVDAYVRKLNPDTKINAGLALSKKINFIKDDRLKELARGAAWIGNDETHIECKHPDRNLSDMKKFIEYIIHLIGAEYAYRDALSMQKGI